MTFSFVDHSLVTFSSMVGNHRFFSVRLIGVRFNGVHFFSVRLSSRGMHCCIVTF